MSIVLKNNAKTTLAANISSLDTTIEVDSVSSFPTLGVDEYFYCTIESTTGAYEIVKVTQVNASSFNVTRAQEDTIAVPFNIGARVEMRVTVQALEDFFDAEVEAEVASKIGVTIQAYDPDLTIWASLTPSANAQSLVTASDYAAMRTLLGLSDTDSPFFTGINIGDTNLDGSTTDNLLWTGLGDAITPANLYNESGETTTFGSFIYRHTDSGNHNGKIRSALVIETRPVGSGTNGPAHSDTALTISSIKQNWTTSTVTGEIGNLVLIGRQGESDCSAILGNWGIRSGAGGFFEAGMHKFNSSGDTLQKIRVLAGTIDTVNNVEFGYDAVADVGTIDNAYRAEHGSGAGLGTFTNFIEFFKDGSAIFTVTGDAAVTGASYKSSTAGLPAWFINTTNSASVQGLRIEGDRGTPTTNDALYSSYYMSNGSGTQIEYARETVFNTVVTAGIEQAQRQWALMSAGSLTQLLLLNPAALSPITNNTIALGTTTLGYSNLFLSSAASVSFNNDTAITRSSVGNIAVGGNLIYRAGGTDVPVTDGGTGASTAGGALTNFGLSANGQSLVTAADYSAMRTLLSLVPGTNFYSTSATDAAIAAVISDTAYNATSWDGVTTIAPSKNAVRDKFASLAQADISGLTTADSPQFTAINLNHATANTLTASGGHMTIEGATVWDSGNDGAGSGLDADLLDGKNTGTSGNVIGLLDGNNTHSGTVIFSGGVSFTSGVTHTGNIIHTNAAPSFAIKETGAAADVGNWLTIADGGVLYPWACQNDAVGSFNPWLTVTRTADVPALAAFSSKVSSTASLHAHSGTSVPAGGTAGAGLLVSSTTNLGIFFGSGVPTLSAAQGSLYIRTDGSTTATRMYINTNGSTTWTNVVTAA